MDELSKLDKREINRRYRKSEEQASLTSRQGSRNRYSSLSGDGSGMVESKTPLAKLDSPSTPEGLLGLANPCVKVEPEEDTDFAWFEDSGARQPSLASLDELTAATSSTSAASEARMNTFQQELNTPLDLTPTYQYANNYSTHQPQARNQPTTSAAWRNPNVYGPQFVEFLYTSLQYAYSFLQGSQLRPTRSAVGNSLLLIQQRSDYIWSPAIKPLP